MYNEKLAVRAGADLSGSQGLAIGVDGTVAGTVRVAFGVLDNKPESGEDASLVFMGRSRLKAGGAITAGASVGVNSTGYFVAVNSGALQCGKALTAVASGGVFTGIVNFATNGG
jgi:hypothetical protein